MKFAELAHPFVPNKMLERVLPTKYALSFRIERLLKEGEIEISGEVCRRCGNTSMYEFYCWRGNDETVA